MGTEHIDKGLVHGAHPLPSSGTASCGAADRGTTMTLLGEFSSADYGLSEAESSISMALVCFVHGHASSSLHRVVYCFSFSPAFSSLFAFHGTAGFGHIICHGYRQTQWRTGYCTWQMFELRVEGTTLYPDYDGVATSVRRSIQTWRRHSSIIFHSRDNSPGIETFSCLLHTRLLPLTVDLCQEEVHSIAYKNQDRLLGKSTS